MQVWYNLDSSTLGWGITKTSKDMSVVFTYLKCLTSLTWFLATYIVTPDAISIYLLVL